MAKLILTTKAGNGRRKSIEIHITDHEATDPMARAQAISRHSAAQTNRVVNWKIDV